MTIHYYLAYGNINGSITTDTVKGTFAIDEFSFGGNVAVDLKAAGGPEVSPPDFSEINLTLGNQSGITEFFKEAAAGKGQSVSIIGIDDQNIQVMDIKLDNVLLSGLFDNTDGLSLTLNYAQIEIDTTLPDGLGGLLLPDPVFGWDRSTDLPCTATGVAPTNSEGPSTAPSKYFLLIDGVNGGSKDPGHLGWFEITSFGNELGRIITDFSGVGGRDASGAFFSQLNLSLAGNTALTALLRAEAAHKVFASARIEGVADDGGVLKAVYDINLGHVVIGSLVENQDQGFDLSLDYRQIEVKTKDFDGSIIGVTDFDLNLSKSGGAAIPDPVVGTGPATAAASDFYLALNGLKGDSPAADHLGWFHIANFQLGTALPIDNSGKSQTFGVPQFGEIVLTLETDTAISNFLQLETLGAINKLISGASIEGTVLTKGGVRTVHDLDLANLHITSISEDSNHNIAISLDYNQIELTTFGVTSGGVRVINPVFGWDLQTNAATKADVTGFHPVNTAAAEGIAPTKYYLAVSGVNGGSTDPNHKGWFELTDYQLNSSMNGGAVDIGLLSASIAGVTGYNTLLKDLVSGTAITTARLEGVVVDGLGAEKTVYQLGLGNVLVAGINDTSDFGFTVDLDFTRVLSRTYSPVTGKLQSNFGWNDATDTQDNTAIAVTPNSKATTHAGVAVEYFLAYDGVDGESLRKGHEKWISVESYSLGNSLPTNNGTAIGNAFAPNLSLHLATESGFAKWFEEVTFGKGHGATLEGIDVNGKIVSTLNLGTAFATSVADNAGQGLDVELSFFQMDLTTQLVDANGTFAGKEKFQWDFKAQNADIGGTKGLVGPSSGTDAIVPSKYYMLVDGANGGVINPAHGGWFNVVDFSMAAGRGVSDKGAGNIEATIAEVANITVLLSDSHALTVLLADMASGTKLGGVIIEGTATDGSPGGEKAVYDLSLGGAYISSINANSGGGYEVQFTAAQFQIDTIPYGGKSHHIVAWDAIKQAAEFDPIAPAPGFTINDDVLTFLGTADFISSPKFSGNDIVYAMGGDDLIFAYDGDTKVFAGAGNDTVLNIGGNNTFDGGDGTDLLSYTNADSGVTVNLNNLLAQNTFGAGIDTIKNFENLDGSDLSDVLTGNNIANVIHGFGGDNVINGLAGNDTLYGGIGNDTMNGGAGVNGIYYDDAFTGVTVDLNLTKAQNTVGAGIDTISNVTILFGSSLADTLTGNGIDNVLNGRDGSDVISGGGGADILQGEAGSDTITGGAGADILFGGADADFFVYNAPGEGGDQISDFSGRNIAAQPSYDTIQIKGSGFGGLAAGSLSNAQFQLASSNVALTTDVRFFFDTNSRVLFYDADGSANTSGPVALAVLTIGTVIIDDILII